MWQSALEQKPKAGVPLPQGPFLALIGRADIRLVMSVVRIEPDIRLSRHT